MPLNMASYFLDALIHTVTVFLTLTVSGIIYKSLHHYKDLINYVQMAWCTHVWH